LEAINLNSSRYLPTSCVDWFFHSYAKYATRSPEFQARRSKKHNMKNWFWVLGSGNGENKPQQYKNSRRVS